MQILFNDDQVNQNIGRELGGEKVTLDELLSESGSISLYIPLTEETK